MGNSSSFYIMQVLMVEGDKVWTCQIQRVELRALRSGALGFGGSGWFVNSEFRQRGSPM